MIKNDRDFVLGGLQDYLLLLCERYSCRGYIKEREDTLSCHSALAGDHVQMHFETEAMGSHIMCFLKWRYIHAVVRAIKFELV